MELEGTVFFDEEWDSLSKMFSTDNNVDLMVHLQGDSDLFLNDHENGDGAPSTFWQAVEANKMINVTDGFFSSDALINTDNKLQDYFSQESSNNSSGNGSFLIDPNAVQSECMDFLVIDQKIAENSNSDPGQLKRKLKNDSIQNPKKKPQVSREGQKNKRNAQSNSKSKRNQKISDNSNEEEEGQNTQSSSCSSIDETETSESKGKTRANRGAATDPQSLYARRRREKINERLRILQSLVPNGTKVDISTMLEEAVHYVKFLQLQIKLLSSDDMWMYAPIAYNGMDIGHFQKMLQPTL